MKVYIKPEKYVLAVSGGVDSMVLLHLLAQQNQVTGYGLRVTDKAKKNSNLQPATHNLELVVAHFNHGIRSDAIKDEKLVRAVASRHKMSVEVERAQLGTRASEATARKARYDFLEAVRLKHKAKLIITAHHQDDLIETAILNIMRGTGRRGVSAISQNSKVLRPLLGYPKTTITSYAKKNNIVWREDSTNQDQTYLRNYIRGNVSTKLTKAQRAQLLENADKVAKTGIKIDQIIATLSRTIKKQDKINRYEFSLLPDEVGRELAMEWLRDMEMRRFDKKAIEKLAIALKTAKSGTIHPVVGNIELEVGERFAHLRTL